MNGSSIVAWRWVAPRAAARSRGLAGHSKWANIKHKKAMKDVQRGSLFTKMSRLVEVGSRLAKGNREHMALASAIARARDANLPKAKIEAAIERGSRPRDKSDPALDSLTFEGLVVGAGVVVEALTDNRSRTAQDVRLIFKKHGGALGTEKSVTWNWKRLGCLRIPAAEAADDDRRDELLAAALDGGADDLDDATADELAVYTEPAAVASTRTAVLDAGFTVVAAELVWRPATLNELPSDAVPSLEAALDAFDDHPDVTAVYHDAAPWASSEGESSDHD